MDENMFDWGSWYDGNDLDLSDGDTSYDYGDSSYWDASDVDANADWTGYSNSGYGDSAGGGYNWSGLIGPGLQAAGSYASALASGKATKEQLELAARLDKERYEHQLAEQEKYYQLHGQQLSDAYKGYEGYYQNPAANPMNNPTNIFGLLTPKPTTGPLANGW